MVIFTINGDWGYCARLVRPFFLVFLQYAVGTPSVLRGQQSVVRLYLQPRNGCAGRSSVRPPHPFAGGVLFYLLISESAQPVLSLNNQLTQISKGQFLIGCHGLPQSVESVKQGQIKGWAGGVNTVWMGGAFFLFQG